jgi:hypothetical protein
MHTRVFSDRLVSGGSDAKLCYPLLSWNMYFMFHDEVRGRECHEGRIQGLVMVVRVYIDEEFAW